MKRSAFSAALIFAALPVLAQVTASGGQTPAQYVNNVLLGNGITAFNVTYTGYSDGIGQFSATPGTNLGFASGLYLTTGSILQNDPNGIGLGNDGPAGPSSNEQSVMQFPSTVDDYDLHRALESIGYDTTMAFGNITNDVNVLEFDFVPNTDSISFRYRFASEEYNDYVSDPNLGGPNDIFAFLLRGVSPAAAAQYPSYQNIALIPNTSTPVSIYTVNNGPSAFGIPSNGPCLNCAYYVDNTSNSVDVIYDGLTTILTARAAVICGETYHIKLAIADVSDQILDSGVFLEAGSFSSSGGVQVISEVNFGPNDTTLVESCNQATLTVIRGGDLNQPLNVNIIYAGSADPLSDFNTTLPNMIGFAPGQDSLQLNITATGDGLSEATETLIIGFITPSGCAGNTFDTTYTQLSITDLPALSVNAGPDIVECNGGLINENVIAVATGGFGTCSYAWNTGAATAAINVTAAGDYIVTATDACMQTASDTLTASVVVPQPLAVSLDPDISVCAGNSVQVTATITGGNGAVDLSWSNGATGNPVTLAPNTTLNLTVTAEDACGLTASDDITITVHTATAGFSYAFISEGTAAFTNESVPAGLSSSWDFGDGSGSQEENPQHTYQVTGIFPVTLTVSSHEGCTSQVTRLVEFSIPTQVFIPNAFSPNGDGQNDNWLVSLSYIRDFRLLVFDRWGGKVFESDNIYDRWKGTFYNGSTELKSDQYVYRILYTEFDGSSKEIIGNVSLLR